MRPSGKQSERVFYVVKMHFSITLEKQHKESCSNENTKHLICGSTELRSRNSCKSLGGGITCTRLVFPNSSTFQNFYSCFYIFSNGVHGYYITSFHQFFIKMRNCRFDVL